MCLRPLHTMLGLYPVYSDTNSLVVKSANSFTFIPRERSRYALDAFQLTCCPQLTRFSIGHFWTVNLKIEQRETHLSLDHNTDRRHREALATAGTETTETREDTTNNTIFTIRIRINESHEHCISIHLQQMFEVDTTHPEYDSSEIIIMSITNIICQNFQSMICQKGT